MPAASGGRPAPLYFLRRVTYLVTYMVLRYARVLLIPAAAPRQSQPQNTARAHAHTHACR